MLLVLLLQASGPPVTYVPPSKTPILRLRTKPVGWGGKERRCVYSYTFWEDSENYERLKLCTVPFKRDPDVIFSPSYCLSKDGTSMMLCADKPDPKRMLESFVPQLECAGRGCE